MFKEINPKDMSFNPFSAIGKQWMLVTAGDESKANTMTASWGGAGVLWNKNVVTCYIRPQRYTREFMEKEGYFSLSFLPEEYRKQLTYCGRTSGRDEDKIANAGFTVCNDYDAPFIEQAETVLICKKLYVDTMKPECILDPANDSANYAEKDYHYMYIAEIVKALVKE